MNALTAERLREMFDYDRTTGIFIRKIAMSSNAPKGAVAGYLRPDGYVQIRVDGKGYRAHRLAWLYVYGEWPPRDLDHEDTIRHHNWIDNLRPATGTQNQANRRRDRRNVTGFKGVTYHRRDRIWQAQIGRHGKLIHLGSFPTAEAAHVAYASASAELFGNFGRAK